MARAPLETVTCCAGPVVSDSRRTHAQFSGRRAGLAGIRSRVVQPMLSRGSYLQYDFCEEE